MVEWDGDAAEHFSVLLFDWEQLYFRERVCSGHFLFGEQKRKSCFRIDIRLLIASIVNFITKLPRLDIACSAGRGRRYAEVVEQDVLNTA